MVLISRSFFEDLTRDDNELFRIKFDFLDEGVENNVELLRVLGIAHARFALMPEDRADVTRFLSNLSKSYCLVVEVAADSPHIDRGRALRRRDKSYLTVKGVNECLTEGRRKSRTADTGVGVERLGHLPPSVSAKHKESIIVYRVNREGVASSDHV